MHKTFLSAAISLALAACGGGGGSESSSAPIAAEAGFDISVDVKGLAGGAVTLQNGQSERVAITSNGLTRVTSWPEGTFFSVSIAQHPDNQHCVVATPTGRVAGAVTISVECADGISLPQGHAQYEKAQIVLLGVPPGVRDATATLAGAPLALLDEGGTLGFQVPPTLASGTHELRVLAGGRMFTRTLQVTASPLPAAPLPYLLGYYADLLSDIDAILAEPATPDGLRVFFTSLRGGIVGEQAKLPALSATEQLELATFLAANSRPLGASLPVSPAASTKGLTDSLLRLVDRLYVRVGLPALSQIRATTNDPCFPHAALIVTGVSAAAAGTFMARIAFGTGPAAPKAALGALGAYGTGFWLIANGLKGFEEHCFDYKKVLPFPDEFDFETKGLVRKSAPAPARIVTAQHGRSTSLDPRLVKRVKEQVDDGTLARVRALAANLGAFASRMSAFAPIPALAELRALAGYQRENLVEVPRTRFEVTVDRPAVSVTTAATAGALPVVFRFTASTLPSAAQRFYLRIRDNETGALSGPVMGLLEPPRAPYAESDGYAMYAGGMVRRALPGGDGTATQHELVGTPVGGTVQMVDAVKGVYVFRAAPGFLGEASFQYRAFNEFGASEAPGTLRLQILPNCETRATGNPAQGGFLSECRFTALSPTQLRALPGVYPGFSVNWTNLDLFPTTVSYNGLRQETRRGDAIVNGEAAPAVWVSGQEMTYDPSTDSFTVGASEGHYLLASGALNLESPVTRQRIALSPHRDGLSYMISAITNARYTHVLNNGSVFPNVHWEEAVFKGAYDAFGAPLYAVTTVSCSSHFVSSTQVVQSVRRETWDSGVRLRSELADGACPIPLAQVVAVARELSPEVLRHDWRTGAVR